MRIKPNRIAWENANSLYQLESEDIVAVLNRNGVKVKNISAAGSLRRGRKTIGDIDIVVEVDNPQLAGNTLEQHMNYQFFAKGSFYKGQILDTGIDLFIAGHHNYYAMLFFLTGCEDWNLRIMKYLKSNTDIRYTPFRFKNLNTKEVYNFNSEEDIFKLINHSYIQPKDRIPKNINFGD